MNYLLLGFIVLACLPIIYRRFAFYRKRQKLLKECNQQGYALMMLDETRLPMLSYGLLFACALWLVFKNQSDLQATVLWVVVALIAVSEMIHTELVRRSYYCDDFFIYYHRKFRYEDIREMSLKTSRILASAYLVKTADQSCFNVTRTFYQVLEAGRSSPKGRRKASVDRQKP